MNSSKEASQEICNNKANGSKGLANAHYFPLNTSRGINRDKVHKIRPRKSCRDTGYCKENRKSKE